MSHVFCTQVNRDFWDGFRSATAADLIDECISDRGIVKRLFCLPERVSGYAASKEMPTNARFPTAIAAAGLILYERHPIRCPFSNEAVCPRSTTVQRVRQCPTPHSPHVHQTDLLHPPP